MSDAPGEPTLTEHIAGAEEAIAEALAAAQALRNKVIGEPPTPPGAAFGDGAEKFNLPKRAERLASPLQELTRLIRQVDAAL